MGLVFLQTRHPCPTRPPATLPPETHPPAPEPSADAPGTDTSYSDAALFLAVSIAFGTAFPAIEVDLTALPPPSFAAARYSLSAVLLLGYAAVSARPGRRAGALAPRRDLTAVAVGGTLLIGATGFLLAKNRELAAELARFRGAARQWVYG